MRIPKPDWIEVAHICLQSRLLDELETSRLTPQGKIKYQFSAGGHELSQVLLGLSLNHPHDAATVYYRSRPFMLASGLTLREALSGGMAKKNSPSQGRDVGVMFNLPRRTGATVLPSSGDVGAQYTPAAGWAQAICYHARTLNQEEWKGAVAAALGGDGSVAANGFWAALNIVATQDMPMMFFIEDNAFGISVPSHFQNPGGNIAANLACYGCLELFEGDGSDPINAWETISAALERTRSGVGPALVRLSVPRLAGHTFIDNQAYKSQELREEEASRDPLIHLRSYVESLYPEFDWESLKQSVQKEIEQALIEAEADVEPDPAEATQHLFYSGVTPHQGGLRPLKLNLEPGSDQPRPEGQRMNLIDAVRRTLESEMAANPRILVFGEDVGVKGGVHGATAHMQERFGEARVFDTSLNEDGIIGRAVGMALSGLLPVPEIQFRKYADPAHEQISDLGTLRWRTANNFAAPIVVRIPVGFSKKTGDPWHSVSGEAVYAHTLGWRIAYPSNAEDAVGLLRSALRSDDPTFFFEHRNLLDTAEARRPYPGDDYCLPFGRAARLLEGREMTVVTWGALVSRCLEAAQAYPGRVEVIDLRTIIPWDKEMVLNCVRQTGKALIVHEDTLTSGFAGEIIAEIVNQCFTDLDAPVERLATPDLPIPYNIPMMNQLIPSVESIQARIQFLLDY